MVALASGLEFLRNGKHTKTEMERTIFAVCAFARLFGRLFAFSCFRVLAFSRSARFRWRFSRSRSFCLLRFALPCSCLSIVVAFSCFRGVFACSCVCVCEVRLWVLDGCALEANRQPWIRPGQVASDMVPPSGRRPRQSGQWFSDKPARCRRTCGPDFFERSLRDIPHGSRRRTDGTSFWRQLLLKKNAFVGYMSRTTCWGVAEKVLDISRPEGRCRFANA